MSTSSYQKREGDPITSQEYARLTPLQKQDWLIRKLRGQPNPQKSGDGGVDGQMRIHLGMDKEHGDIWGDVIFQVKTGKQHNPASLRELWGTMETKNASIGVLITDKNPSKPMVEFAKARGEIHYTDHRKMKVPIPKLQIITSDEIMSGARIRRPPSMTEVRKSRITPVSYTHLTLPTKA